MLKSEAILKFLMNETHSDLANLYNFNMEVQLNVAPDGGQRTEGDFKGRKWQGYTDGMTVWKPIRIPYKANSEPEYIDTEMQFDIRHAEGIGMTGWDWVHRCSKWVAFDFDAITGHSERHAKKLTDVELNEVEERIRNIPWVTLRRSTSGKGLHLYVFLDNIFTANHTEHQALARAILGILTALTGYDFSSKVDAVGGNMWIYHRKMKGTEGLKLLKAGGVLTKIPPNWRDHIPVISGKKRKNMPHFIENVKDEDFQEFTGKRTKIALDVDHQRLITWLDTNQCQWWWDNEHWMLITHTFHLKKAHEALGLKGLFKTLAMGTETPNDHNCFAFPMRRGSWSVRRYAEGTPEADTWNQDGQRWTHCRYNCEPDLGTVARTYSGIEQEKGGFVFKTAEQALEVSKIFGSVVKVPDSVLKRETTIKEHKDGRLIMEIRRDTMDNAIEGWLADKNSWKKILDSKIPDPIEAEVNLYDDLVRHVVTSGGDDSGWTVKSDGNWKNEPLVHVKALLYSLGNSTKDVNNVIGSNILKAWTLVNKPFEAEYPSDRQWNRDAVQFRFQPTKDMDNLSYPTWLKILNHCGRGLDAAIKEDNWCASNGIICGGDYLKCWVASLFQHPLEPLPYLFFYGPERTGKTIFHEAIRILVTHGIVKAAETLLSDYNGELANAIVAVVEELDLGSNKKALNRIKDYVTAKEIAIRPLYQQTYMMPNALKWIQCANSNKFCPILPGDTRITVCPVMEPPQEPIPRKQIYQQLEKEAPDFLAAVLSLEIPMASDPRLNLPVIITEEKLIVAESNQNLLDMFLNEKCFYVPGALIKYSDLFERFTIWLDPQERPDWHQRKMGHMLPTKYPKGRIASGDWYVGNIAFEEKSSSETPYSLHNGKLVQYDAPKIASGTVSA